MYSTKEVEFFHGEVVKVVSKHTGYVYVGTLDACYGLDVNIFDLIETTNPGYIARPSIYISIGNIKSIEVVSLSKDPATLYGGFLPNV